MGVALEHAHDLVDRAVIETVDFHAFGDGPTRFIPMGIENVTNVGLSAYLLRSAAMRRRFSAG